MKTDCTTTKLRYLVTHDTPEHLEEFITTGTIVFLPEGQEIKETPPSRSNFRADRKKREPWRRK